MIKKCTVTIYTLTDGEIEYCEIIAIKKQKKINLKKLLKNSNIPSDRIEYFSEVIITYQEDINKALDIKFQE
jgi:hypothetical protein